MFIICRIVGDFYLVFKRIKSIFIILIVIVVVFFIRNDGSVYV